MLLQLTPNQTPNCQLFTAHPLGSGPLKVVVGIQVSTLFARMAVLIIDATLVKKPIPHLHWETLVPLVGAIASHGDFAGLSVPFFGGGPLHEIGLETVLPFLCVAGWASFLHLLGSLTSACASPDHPPVSLLAACGAITCRRVCH